MWIADAAYPDGRRLPMTPGEQAGVDADLCDEVADVLEAFEATPGLWVDPANAARCIAEAARLLRLGVD